LQVGKRGWRNRVEIEARSVSNTVIARTEET